MRLIRLIASVAALLAMSQIAAHAASAEKGRAAFVKHGCWQCHGFVGQGGPAGPKIAPNPLPFKTLSAFVRLTDGRMPPFQETVLSNADLADIYAYLQSIPKSADYKSIPLLNQ